MVELQRCTPGFLHPGSTRRRVHIHVTSVVSVVFEVVVATVVGSTQRCEVIDVGVAALQPRRNVVDLGLRERGGAAGPGAHALHRQQRDPLRKRRQSPCPVEVQRQRRCFVDSQHEVGSSIHAQTHEVEGVELDSGVGGELRGRPGLRQLVQRHRHNHGRAPAAGWFLAGVIMLEYLGELVVPALRRRAVILHTLGEVRVGHQPLIAQRFE